MRVCILLLVFAAAIPCAGADEGERLYRKAADHYYSFIKSSNEKAFHSNWDKLIREFQDVAEAYPGSHKADDAWYMAGKLCMDCYRFSGDRADLEFALNAFAMLVERYPESTLADDAQYFRGEIYLKLGDIEAARQEYELVISKFRRGDMVRNAHGRL
jgi:TolA-binding protein